MASSVRPHRALAKVAVLALSGVLLFLLVTSTGLASFHRLAAALLPSQPAEAPAGDAGDVMAGGASLGPASLDLGWHAPAQRLVNNLTHVMSADTKGVDGFVYHSSMTPDEADGAHNWCNMPHVRPSAYVRPADEYELVYVELMHRHHKRTPYAANSFPVESYPWNCADAGLYSYAEPFSSTSSVDPNAGRNASGAAYWVGTSDVAGFTNPFAITATGFQGSCQFPQITAAGLDDSWQHGADLYATYGEMLGFLPDRADDEDDRSERRARSREQHRTKHHKTKHRSSWRDKVQYRVTNNVITSEVAGLVIGGMWRTTDPVPLLIQRTSVDGLEPSYTCRSAAAGFSAIRSGANAAWQAHLDAAAGLYEELDGLSGVAPDDEGFHASVDHYYDNLSARQCHGKPLPCKLVNSTDARGRASLANDTSACVDQDLADLVYRVGHWEYSHMYRDAGAATLAASVGSLGVWVAELSAHLKAVLDGRSRTIWFHNVAHDGSVSRLLSILQIDDMVWPGMGSEVLFELWKQTKKHKGKSESASGHYVRVLFGGRVLKSSNPWLGVLDLVPVERLLAYFDGLTGVNASLIVEKCKAS